MNKSIINGMQFEYPHDDFEDYVLECIALYETVLTRGNNNMITPIHKRILMLHIAGVITEEHLRIDLMEKRKDLII